MSDTTTTPAEPAKLDPTSITAAIHQKADKALESRVEKAFDTLRRELQSMGSLYGVTLGYMMRTDADRSKLTMSSMYEFRGDAAIMTLQKKFVSEVRDSERQKAVDAFVAKVEAVEDQVQELHNMVDDVRNETLAR